MIYHCYPHFGSLKRSVHEGFRALKCLLIRATDFQVIGCPLIIPYCADVVQKGLLAKKLHTIQTL